VGIVPGATAVVHVTGGAGPLVASPSFAGVDVVSDTSGRTLTLTGVANGRGIVTLSDAAGDTAAVSVLVAPPAGVVPADETVDLAGTVSPQFVTARNPSRDRAVGADAAGDDARRQRADCRHAASRRRARSASARRRRGNDTYVDQSGVTNVHLRVAALPRLDPAVLLYSDDPERLGPLDDGVLFRATIDPALPARVYVYHVSRRAAQFVPRPRDDDRDGARAGVRPRRPVRPMRSLTSAIFRRCAICSSARRRRASSPRSRPPRRRSFRSAPVRCSPAS